ncbi:MAG: hypothetical protein OXG07_01855 [Anaerolineaceae bacterium]|nr:hypothetical protein [Anaerolineaceae bacterium]
MSRREGYPELTPAFTWTALVLGLWVFFGSVVDINAHNHGFVDDTFFTPFHLLLYSGVAANGLFYVIAQFRNVGRGHSLMKALPKEYLLSFAGVLLFGIGGVFDLAWHEIFGFEEGVDALVSPSHLLLVVAGMMFISGPLRSFLSQGKSTGGWSELFPPIASATAILTIGTLFTLYTNVWTQLSHYVTPEIVIDSPRPLQAYTVAGVLIPAALMAGTIIFLRQRVVLPFGAVTFVFLANALIMLYIRWEWNQVHVPVLLAPIIAGLLGDWLLARPERGSHVIALRQFAFVVPAVYMLALFILLQLTGGGIWWTEHMWPGVSLMAGAAGLGVAALLTTKPYPQAD